VTTPARRSEAAVVLVRDGGRFLCQWSDTWHALHLVGGHREGGESFRDCAAREAAEELPAAAAGVVVAPAPAAVLEYDAFSRSAGVDTRYVVAVFPARLTTAARPGVDADPANRWVSRDDIRSGRTNDGTPVSPTVDLILTKLGL
jgi:8-oxo-dGTP pyrophosphatase MutT (NUDIX family)